MALPKRLRFLLSRAGLRLWSHLTFLILASDRQQVRDAAPQLPLAPGSTVRRMVAADIPEVATIYPDDFCWMMTAPEVERLLRRRQSICPVAMVACIEGDIVGATWCLPIEFSRLQTLLPPGRHTVAYEVTSTFLLQRARRSGLAAAMRTAAMDAMADAGYHYALTQIRSDRVPAVRLNEALGFRLLAVEERTSIAGWRTIRMHGLPPRGGGA